jgi:hypothetical protein
MGDPVSRRIRETFGSVLLLGLLWPSGAAAQSPPAPQSVPAETSRLWLTAGVSFTAVRGDCQVCEEDYPYRRTAGIFGNLGYRVNDRMDVGAEIFWVPVETADGNTRTTHFDAVAQFRPWSTQGFFIKGGAGLGFIRNWVEVVGPQSLNSKTLSLVIGGGWVFRPRERLGLQLSATQHVVALGDLQTAQGPIDDVVGNFWSLAVAVVIR